MPALPGAQRDMNVDDVAVTSLRAYQPDHARGVQRHDGNVDITGFQQPGKADPTGAAPCLGDRPDWNADGATTPKDLVQPCLHDDGLSGMVKGEKRAGVEGKSCCRTGSHPASLSSRPARPVRPARSSSSWTWRRVSSGTGVSAFHAASTC